MKPYIWRLAVIVTMSVWVHAVASAQTSVSAKPSSQAKHSIAKLMHNALPAHDIDPQRIPKRFQQQVVKRVYEYTALYRKDTQTMVQRATPFLPMMKQTLQRHDLPDYFAYIPMVESAFRVEASHPGSGARGLWQLMPATARGFGLRVSSHVDERLDPKRATQAAARYLQKLQDRFGRQSPLHVLAAYNHGDTNLAKAMRRHQTRDIWRLYTRRHLPYQTREYLVKMVTLWVVMAHAEQFDLGPNHAVPPPLYTMQPQLPTLQLSLTAALQPALTLASR